MTSVRVQAQSVQQVEGEGLVLNVAAASFSVRCAAKIGNHLLAASVSCGRRFDQLVTKTEN